MVVVIVTNAQPRLSVVRKDGILVPKNTHNFYYPFGFSISRKPIFGVALKTRKVEKKRVLISTICNSGEVNVLLKGESGNRVVDGGIIGKEFEFKPSFDEYLKAMESVKSDRDRRDEHSSNIRKLQIDSRGETQKGLVFDKVISKESGNRNVKHGRKTGFEEKGNIGKARVWVRDDLDCKGSERDANFERKNNWRNAKSQTSSVQEILSDKFEVQRFKADFESGGVKGEEVLQKKNATNKLKQHEGNKFISKERGDDKLEMERAAFKPLEEYDDLCDKPRVSRVDMEERIQKLAKSLNGADIDIPEWMFAKMMRSARIRFSDHSMLRIIQLLGKQGNWRQVLQVIEWIESRERFKSNKIRYIYTAALDALGKARRPVEALNVFCAMQQHMSSYPDLVAYHCVAVTLGQAGHMKELFDVIDSMQSLPKKKFNTGVLEKWDPRLEPDIVVYNAVLNACARRKNLEGAFWVLQQLRQQGQQPSSTTYGLVMEVMFACGKYNFVHDFFKKVQKSSIPKALTYKVLVNTFWREGRTDEAILAVKDMEKRGIVGTAALYYDLARCLCSAGRCEEALIQVDKICKVANKPLVVTYTGLVQACLDSGNIHNGAYVFNYMHKFCSPNLVTCNIMLKAYLDHGLFAEAKNMFLKLLDNGNNICSKLNYKDKVIPDIYTFNLMLDACVAEQRWDDLEFLYQQMLQHGYHFNAKRHLRMILDACTAGKGELLEITWKHLAQLDRVSPPLLIKEMFFKKLQEADYASALCCLNGHELHVFSPRSWLNFFREKAHLFRRDTLVSLEHEVSIFITKSVSSNLMFQNLLTSCREYLRTQMTLAETDQTETISRPPCETALKV